MWRKGNPPTLYLDKTIIKKHTCTFMSIAALFTIAKTWKQAKCLSAEELLGHMVVLFLVFKDTFHTVFPGGCINLH